MNINNNYITYKTKTEIDKMSYNEKYLTCKCGKKPEFRWKESSLHEGKGLYYGIKPFKGRNNEELCHKCAPCVKCGKERAYLTGGESCRKSEKTNDNLSGEWALAYCSIECFHGTEKPSLPKKAPENFHLKANCDHCGKWSEIKVGNAYWGKSFCSVNCYELAYTRAGSRETRDEIRAHCCACGFRIFGQDGNYTEDFQNRKDKKAHWSDKSINAFYCSETCFEKRGDKGGVSCRCEDGYLSYNYGPTQSDNSSKPNPAAPAPQSITNENSESDNSVKVNPGNFPQPNPGVEKAPKDSPKIVINQEGNQKNNPGKVQPNETKPDNNQVLVINLKDIKKISLVGDSLVIEFNQSEQTQTIVSEQVNSSQELSMVKNYLQTTQRSSVNSQELANVISQKDKGADNSNPNSPNQTSKSPFLWVASVGAIGVMVGLCCGLVVQFKKLRSKKK